jgi:hypothetical protein
LSAGDYTPSPPFNGYGRPGRTPDVETYAQVKAERDELRNQVQNQRKMVADNEQLRLRVASLEKQVRAWRENTNVSMVMQKCSICQDVKPVGSFWRDRSTKRGYRSQCRDCANPGRKIVTHCPQGHPYDEANTRRDKNGWRHCRTCSHAKTEYRG